MKLDPSQNAAYLKLDLYCKGIRLDPSCLIEESGGRKILRTRAGLGSGLEAILPGNLWTNIPVAERFASWSPYSLHQVNGRFEIHKDGARVTEVNLAPRPAWYSSRTSTGKPMTQIGSLQGTYLGIYPSKVCDYWREKPKANCRFCSVGLNLGYDDATEKSLTEVMEVVHAARAESAITYVDFNTGHYEGDTYLDILEPYIRRVKEETGLLVGVQTPPHHDLSRYDRLQEMGVNRVSFCFEIFDEERFAAICPGKNREYGLRRYLKAVEYCAGLSRRANPLVSPWVTNGEIIAGLETPESTIRAIDWITTVGAIPTVCIFRPLKGTDCEDLYPPETEDMVPVFARLYEACMERGLPIGIAPNVHVSLVLLPEECRSLYGSPGRFFLQEKLNAMKAWAFARTFRGGVQRALERYAGSTAQREAGAGEERAS